MHAERRGTRQLQKPNQQRPRDATDTANRDALEGALSALTGAARGECTNRSIRQKQSCTSSADCDSSAGSGDGRCKGRFVAFEPPLTTRRCTAFADIRVPLKQTAAGARAAKKLLRLSASPSKDSVSSVTRAADRDALTLICNPSS